MSLNLYTVQVLDISPIFPPWMSSLCQSRNFLTNHVIFDPHILTYIPTILQKLIFSPKFCDFLDNYSNLFIFVFFFEFGSIFDAVDLISLSLKHHPSITLMTLYYTVFSKLVLSFSRIFLAFCPLVSLRSITISVSAF